MEVPEGLDLKIYKTLIALYADQKGIIIKCKIEHGGEWVEIDTSKLLLEDSK
jgi:hypothetical protein